MLSAVPLRFQAIIVWTNGRKNQDLISVSDKTSSCKISQNLEAAGIWFVFRIVRSLWNLTGSMCLSNFKAIPISQQPISYLRNFARSHDKPSYRILKRGPELWHIVLFWYSIMMLMKFADRSQSDRSNLVMWQVKDPCPRPGWDGCLTWEKMLS